MRTVHFRSFACRTPHRVIFQRTVRAGGSSAMASSGAERAIVWFRGTDLRVHDNEVLSKAAELAARSGGDVVPVFCYGT